MIMTNKHDNTAHIAVHTIRKQDIDIDTYEYMSSMVSELKNMKSFHEFRNGGPDMISYSLGKAIDYCQRTMSEIEMRARGELK